MVLFLVSADEVRMEVLQLRTAPHGASISTSTAGTAVTAAATAASSVATNVNADAGDMLAACKISSSLTDVDHTTADATDIGKSKSKGKQSLCSSDHPNEETGDAVDDKDEVKDVDNDSDVDDAGGDALHHIHNAPSLQVSLVAIFEFNSRFSFNL